MTATTLEASESQHTWWMPGRVEGGSWVWEEGWKVEEDDGRFEVYYHTHERMRFGADGSLSFGPPAGYWFNTREWAELCAERLNSLDRAFGRVPTSLTLAASGNFGIGTMSPQYKFQVIGEQAKPIVSVGPGGAVEQIDVPQIIAIWWRGTTAYRVWRKLMWGEKA